MTGWLCKQSDQRELGAYSKFEMCFKITIAGIQEENAPFTVREIYVNHEKQ